MVNTQSFAQICRLLIFPLLAALSACKGESVEEPEIIRPVRYAQIQYEASSITRTFSGITRAAIETDMSFKVAGLISELPVKVGSRLTEGQLLARLDASDYEVAVEQVKASLAQARAQLANESSYYQRVQPLLANDAISRADFEAVQTRYQSAAAQVELTEQQLRAAELQLGYTQLRSPMDCAVADLLAEVNQNVRAGQTIVRVNCGQCPEVVFDVPSQMIAGIGEGDDARVVIDNRESIPAVVTSIGIDTSSTRSTYQVKVMLAEACDLVRAGTSANVELTFVPEQIVKGAFIVPFVAVGEDIKGNFVYVLTPVSPDLYKADRRTVTVGGLHPRGLILAEGLAENELIATAGVRFLREGQTVKLLEEGGI